MKLPPCKNPNHPKGANRLAGMIVLEENSERVVFACKTCKEVEKILSVQVRTLPRGWAAAKARNELSGAERAKQVWKNQTGKITYFH